MSWPAKVKLDHFEVLVTVKWTCPKCKHQNEESLNGSPYTAIAEDPWDSDCKSCGEFYSMNFYEDR